MLREYDDFLRAIVPSSSILSGSLWEAGATAQPTFPGDSPVLPGSLFLSAKGNPRERLREERKNKGLLPCVSISASTTPAETGPPAVEMCTMRHLEHTQRSLG